MVCSATLQLRRKLIISAVEAMEVILNNNYHNPKDRVKSKLVASTVVEASA